MLINQAGIVGLIVAESFRSLTLIICFILAIDKWFLEFGISSRCLIYIDTEGIDTEGF